MNWKPVALIITALLTDPISLHAQKTGSTIPDTSRAVDTCIVRLLDVTNDGIADSILCTLKAPNWNMPLSITCVIISNKKTILKETYINDFFDQDFGNKDVDNSCTGGYLICKQQWYREVLPAKIARTIILTDEQRATMKEYGSDYSVATTLLRFYTDSLHLKKSDAKKAVGAITLQLKQKQSLGVIMIPVIPYRDSFPRLYDPKSGKFLTMMGL